MAIDIGFARIFIVVVCFLGITALMISFFASDSRWVTAQDVRLTNVPTEWNGINLRSLNLTDSYDLTINTTGTPPNPPEEALFDIGGRNLVLTWYNYPSFSYVKLFHRAGVGLQWWESMRWYNSRGEEQQYSSGQYGVDEELLDDTWGDFGLLQYTVKSDWPFQVIVLFAFNITTYDLPSQAWDADDLDIFIGIEWEYMSTTYSAWDIVGMMLFFQMPNTNPYINALIAIPIWAAIGLFAAIIILEFIRAIKPFG